MSEKKQMVGEVYKPAPEIVQNAHIPDYDIVNNAATADLAVFWGKIA
jgi:hypothetical protein